MTATIVDSSRTEFLQVPGQDLEAEWTTLQKFADDSSAIVLHSSGSDNKVLTGNEN